MNRISLIRTALFLSLGGTLACGDGSTNPFDSNSGGTDTTTVTASGTTAGSASASASATASASDTAATTTDSESDTGIKYDLPDGGPGSPCNCEVEYVWIANSEESTVSKIDVKTLQEVGRYLTRADAKGNPSRTSVSLSGDVAVANRHGGLAKFFGDPSLCQDTNGTPGIQTSTGKGDVLAWDQEECRAWYSDFDVTNQRPVAWAQGTVVPGTCNASDEKVWTVASTVKALFPGLGGQGGATAYLLNGDTGQVDNQVDVPTFPGGGLGAYGGAVDAAGNLYFTSMGPNGKLVRVDRESFAYQLWSVPGEVGAYGITVDHKGRVWLSSVSIGQIGAARFDPANETWELVTGFWGGAGLGEGPGNLMWISSNQGVSSVDIDTLAPGPVFLTTELVKGVGFDSDGFMFAATYATEDDMGNWEGTDTLFKVDPDTLIVDNYYDGLNRPYTYSDMTGFALGNVTCPPEG